MVNLTACTLYLLTSTTLMHVDHLSQADATAKFWEYNQHEHYPEVALGAVYCGKRLILIQNEAYTDAVVGGTHLEDPANPPAQ